MGTRADFYVAKSDELEWLGSIAWDGQEIGHISMAHSEDSFRQCVEEFFAGRDDVTRPDRGWPWPWNDSRLTNCAYVFVEGHGVVTRLGDSYDRDSSDDGICRAYVSKRLLDDPPEDWVWDEEYGHEKNATIEGISYIYPDMSARKRIRLDAGSGMIVLTS